MKIENTLILLFTFWSLWGCNENFSGGDRNEPATQAEETFGQIPQSFSTRLSSTLLVSGDKCRGDETTEPYGNGVICQAGQYLIFVDDVNICSNDICTNNVVIPIVGELNDTNAGTPGFSVYEIETKSRTTPTQDNILNSLLVRSDELGNAEVISRFP